MNDTLQRGVATRDLLDEAEKLGLDYTEHGVRYLRRQHGHEGAKAWMRDIASLIVYADLVWPEVALNSAERHQLPLTVGQAEASGYLREAGGDLQRARRFIDHRATAAHHRAQAELDRIIRSVWGDEYADEGRSRHARLTAAFEMLGGTLGRRAMLMLSMGEAGEIGVSRFRRALEERAQIEHRREFPHALDQDAARLVVPPGASLAQRIDPYAFHRQFREDVEDILAELAETLAGDEVEEGWTPSERRLARVESDIERRFKQFLHERRIA